MRVEMGNLRNLKIVWIVFALVVVLLAGCAAPLKVDSTPTPVLAAGHPVNTVVPSIAASPLPVASPAAPQNLKVPSPVPTTAPTPIPSQVREVSPTLGTLAYISVTFTSPYSLTDEQPLVDGNRLFFTAGNLIILHDLQTGKTSRIVTSVEAICYLDVSQNWLTWLAYPDQSDWQVYAKNLTTGEEIVIDRDEDAGKVPTLRGPYLAISGDRLVWASYRKVADGPIKSDVMVYNLTTRQKQILAEVTDPESLGYVDIDGSRVVWSKGSTEGGIDQANVYLYDLSTHQQSQLTQDGQSGQPQIHGDWVAWQQGFNDTGPLVLYNLKTGEQIDNLGPGYYIQLGDGVMTWLTTIGPVRTYIYDIERNVVVPIIIPPNYAIPLHLTGRSFAMAELNPDPHTGQMSIEVRTYLP